MKICIKFLVITVVVLISIKVSAHVCNQKIKMTSGTFFNPENHLQSVFSDSTNADSLTLLKVNYPAVYRKLIKAYNNAENLKYLVEGKVLYASFNINRHKVSAVFSLRGYIRYSIANLGSELPKQITQKLKIEYPAYTIFFGREIKINNETLYQVIIEDSYEYRVINFMNEEMEEQRKVKKLCEFELARF